MRKRELLLVEWDDIAATDSWHKEEDVKEFNPIHSASVGWNIGSDRKNLRLVSTRCETGKCADIIAIPRGCIRNIMKIHLGVERDLFPG